MRKLAVNLIVAGVSVLAAFALLEFVVFRFVIVAPDLPTVAFEDGVIRYQPNQIGVKRIASEVEAEYRINEQGWNSGHVSYQAASASGTTRIAIVGDSYVEATTVPYDQSLAEQLESLLGRGFQVYRFGMSGAPLSQHLHVARHVARRYETDWLAVVIVSNDFTESYTYQPGVYTSSFLKLQVEGDRAISELPPSGYETRWFDPIRHHSATWRTLAYRYNIRFSALRRLLLGRDRIVPAAAPGDSSFEQFDSRFVRDSLATDYVLSELKELANQMGAELLLLLDGDRSDLEADEPDLSSYPRQRNRMVDSIAGDLRIPVINLDPRFREAFHGDGVLPHHVHDYHWSVDGHRIAAQALREFIVAGQRDADLR